MRYAKITALLLVCLLNVGCLVPSINPLYKTSDLIFDDSLIGTWVDPEEGESLWSFKKLGPLTYTLYITENDELTSFEAHLLKIKNLYFIDIFPLESYTRSDFYNSHLVPAHTFYHVLLENNQLVAFELNYDWFSSQAKSGNIDIDYFQNDDMYVLTANTKSLQEFVLQNFNDCFGKDEIVLVKLR